MGIKRICDLCGRELLSDNRELKVKVKERWYSWPDDRGWNRVERHKECLRVLLEAARKRREEEPQGVQEPYLIDRNELLKDLNATLAYNAEINAVIMAQTRRRMLKNGK